MGMHQLPGSLPERTCLDLETFASTRDIKDGETGRIVEGVDLAPRGRNIQYAVDEKRRAGLRQVRVVVSKPGQTQGLHAVAGDLR